MSEWIDVTERLPEIGERVMIRGGSAKGEKEAVWEARPAGGMLAFFLSDSWCLLTDSVAEWRPAITTAGQVRLPRKIRYTLSPEGRHAKSEKMKEYWRKRKAALSPSHEQPGAQADDADPDDLLDPQVTTAPTPPSSPVT